MPQLEDLDTDEPLARRVQRHDFDRLIMLSDGVFAIAITLAAIEVRLPEVGTVTEILHSAWPVLSAYAISFFVIAAFWAAQRRLMARVARVSAGSSALNLLLLGLVALIPAATRMIVSQDLQHADAWLLYLGLIAACGVVLAATWLHAAFVGHLLCDGVSRSAAAAQAVSAAATPILVASAVLTYIRHPTTVGLAVLVGVIAVVRSTRLVLHRRFPL